MEDKLYVILYKKLNINEYNLFIPVSLIAGTYIDDVFADELGNTYLNFEDINVPEENADYRVGLEINESELLKKYQGDILENCKMYYFDDVKNIIFLGMVNILENKMDLASISVDMIFDPDLDEAKTENDEMEIEITDQNNPSDSKLPKLYLDYNLLNDLIKIKDLKTITENLLTVKNIYISLASEMPEYKESIEKILENEQKELKRNNKKENTKKAENKRIDVPKLYKYVTKRVIGQDNAVKEIISCIAMDELTNDPTEKNRGILIGETGTGKTLILDTISKYLNKPIIKFDSTQLTMPGYVGASIEDVLTGLIYKAGGDIEKAQNGIVVFDEIDKKGSRDNSDVSGKGVLNTLLPFLDGTNYTLRGKNVFNTSNLTVFFTGAFTDVYNAVSKENKTIGFDFNNNSDNRMEIIKREDLVKYGLMPEELIGRISNIVQLSSYNIDSLIKILKKSRISPIIIEREKLKQLNIRMICQESFIEEVAKKAYKNNMGARELKNIVTTSLTEAKWEILSRPNKYKTLKINGETVDNPKKYILK